MPPLPWMHFEWKFLCLALVEIITKIDFSSKICAFYQFYFHLVPEQTMLRSIIKKIVDISLRSHSFCHPKYVPVLFWRVLRWAYSLAALGSSRLPSNWSNSFYVLRRWHHERRHQGVCELRCQRDAAVAEGRHRPSSMQRVRTLQPDQRRESATSQVGSEEDYSGMIEQWPIFMYTLLDCSLVQSSL